MENLLLDETKRMGDSFFTRHGIAGFGLRINPSPHYIRIFRPRAGVKKAKFQLKVADLFRSTAVIRVACLRGFEPPTFGSGVNGYPALSN